MDKFRKIKNFIEFNKKELYISVSFVLIAFISFSLGRISVFQEQKYPIWIESVPEEELIVDRTASAVATATVQDFYSQKLLIGSKNSDKYHYIWCEGAKKISEQNKIYFSSKEEAEKAGYKPAKNCAGL